MHMTSQVAAEKESELCFRAVSVAYNTSMQAYASKQRLAMVVCCRSEWTRLFRSEMFGTTVSLGIVTTTLGMPLPDLAWNPSRHTHNTSARHIHRTLQCMQHCGSIALDRGSFQIVQLLPCDVPKR